LWQAKALGCGATLGAKADGRLSSIAATLGSMAADASSRGGGLYAAGDHAGAAAAFTQVLACEIGGEQEGTAHFWLGMCQQAQGQLEPAVRSFGR
jgi:TolA-binding protein